MSQTGGSRTAGRPGTHRVGVYPTLPERHAAMSGSPLSSQSWRPTAVRVHVEVFGAIEKPFGKNALYFTIAENARLEDLLLALGYRPGHLRFVVAMVNGAQKKLGDALEEGDEVALVVPAPGG